MTQIVLVLMAIGIGITSCASEQQATPMFESTPTATLVATEVEVILPEATEAESTVETPVEEIMPLNDVYTEVDPSGQVITFWHPFTGDREAVLLEIVDDFNDSNQWGLLVEASYQGDYDALQNKMLTFMNSREAPSLLVTNETQAAVYQLGEAIVDLNPLLKHDVWGLTEGESGDFYPGLIDHGIFQSFNGMRLNFPLYGTMNVLYYNADWLAEMGYNGPPNTPDVFLEAACTAMGQPFSGATATGRIGYQMDVQLPSFSDWSLVFGSRLFDHTDNRYNYDSGTVSDAMTFLQGMVNRGCATTSPSMDGPQVDFGRGTLLFVVDSTDKIPDYRSSVQGEANFNWRIAPLPHTTNLPVTNVSGPGASISQKTPREQLAAWLFLKYFMSPETQAKWVMGTNTLPVRAGAAEYLGDYFTGSPAYQMTTDLLMQSDHEPSVPGYSQVQVLSQGTLATILDGADVAESLAALSSEANQILEEQMALIPESPDPWVEVDPSGQTIAYWHQHHDTNLVVLDNIIREFNATNKWGITIVPESKDGYGDIFLNLLPVLGTDESPNLVVAYQHQAAAYQEVGGIMDMTSLVESTKWGLHPDEFDDFYPAIYRQDSFPIFDGARLGFPIQRSTDVLYYNAAWLSELGFDGPPTTPDEFKEMACAGSTPFSGSTNESSSGYQFYVDSTRFTSWVYAFGGEIFDDDTNRYLFNGEGVSSVVPFMLDLIESGCAVPITDRLEAQIAFSEGSLLFMVDSSFHIPTMTSLVDDVASFDWTVAPLPSRGDTPVQHIFGASISIPESTPEKELASWLFIKYFTSPEVQARWGQGIGYLPVRISAGDYLAGNPVYQTAFELLAFGKAAPSVPGYDFVGQEVELALDAILGGLEVVETLDALNATANQVLAIHLER